MRISGKRFELNSASQDVFNVDFHHFMSASADQSAIELAQEFGLSLKDIKYLKEKINRS